MFLFDVNYRLAVESAWGGQEKEVRGCYRMYEFSSTGKSDGLCQSLPVIILSLFVGREAPPYITPRTFSRGLWSKDSWCLRLYVSWCDPQMEKGL